MVSVRWISALLPKHALQSDPFAGSSTVNLNKYNYWMFRQTVVSLVGLGPVAFLKPTLVFELQCQRNLIARRPANALNQGRIQL